jgi:anti-sigma B factor antagonist
MDGELAVGVRREPGYAVVTVAGDLDIISVAGLREELFELAASGLPLVADLDQVTFIDSAGLAVLVGAARRAAASGGSLAVVCGQPRTRKLLALTGLDRGLALAGTVAEAVAALPAARRLARGGDG